MINDVRNKDGTFRLGKTYMKFPVMRLQNLIGGEEHTFFHLSKVYAFSQKTTP